MLERRGLRVHGALAAARVGVREDVEALGVGGHEPVLDAVVHHLHEVPGAVRPAVVVAVLRLARIAGSARGAVGGVHARRDRGEDGREPLDDVGLAADHQAEAACEAPHAAARSDVDVVDAVLRELGGVADVLDVVRVAAVDDRVARLEHLGERRDRLRRDVAGGHHHPYRARLLELRCEVLERGRAGRAVGLERLHGVGGDVVADAGVTVLHEPADDAGAHPAEPDHSELQGSVRGHRSAPSQDETFDGVREAVVVVRRGDMPRRALHLPMAFPIAIDSPERANMSTSFGMSPIVAMRSSGME